MSLLIRVFHIAKRRDAPGKYALFRLYLIGRMDFLGDVLAVLLIDDRLKRRVLILIQGVDVIVDGDIPAVMPRKEILPEPFCIEVVPSKPAVIFGQYQIDLPAYNVV